MKQRLPGMLAEETVYYDPFTGQSLRLAITVCVTAVAAADLGAAA